MKLIPPWRYRVTFLLRCRAIALKPSRVNRASSSFGVRDTYSTNSKPSVPSGFSQGSAIRSAPFPVGNQLSGTAGGDLHVPGDDFGRRIGGKRLDPLVERREVGRGIGDELPEAVDHEIGLLVAVDVVVGAQQPLEREEIGRASGREGGCQSV